MFATSVTRGTLLGLAVGIVTALVFVLIVRILPSSVLVSTGWVFALYVVQVPVGLFIASLSRLIAPPMGGAPVACMAGVCAGVGLTDGILMGFWSSVYGQSGDALLAVAALIIWGVTCNVAGVHVALAREPSHAA
jgi:hypothetical protein